MEGGSVNGLPGAIFTLGVGIPLQKVLFLNLREMERNNHQILPNIERLFLSSSLMVVRVSVGNSRKSKQNMGIQPYLIYFL